MPHLNEDFCFGLRIQAQEEKRSSLSAVIRLREKESATPPSGTVRIVVEGTRVRPVKNTSGDYLFFNLVPKKQYTFSIESENYQPQKIEMIIPDHDEMVTTAADGRKKLIPANEIMEKILRVVELQTNRLS